MVSLSSLSKILYFEAYYKIFFFFIYYKLENNYELRKTWEGIYELLNRLRKRKQVSALQCRNNSGVTPNTSEITYTFNHYLDSIGSKLARNIQPSRKTFHDYFVVANYVKSFLFLLLILTVRPRWT